MKTKENFWRKNIIFEGGRSENRGGQVGFPVLKWFSSTEKNKADLDDHLNVADEIDAEGVDDVDDEDEADEDQERFLGSQYNDVIRQDVYLCKYIEIKGTVVVLQVTLHFKKIVMPVYQASGKKNIFDDLGRKKIKI